MHDVTNFRVDGKTLSIPASAMDADSFMVASTPRPYETIWESDFDRVADSICNSLCDNHANFLLVDNNVLDLHFKGRNIPSGQIFKMNAVELEKNLDTVCKVIDSFERLSPSKNNVMHVVGGGITQDIGAFAACIYKRGLPWKFYPTTLLSMCDSCIGGKTGINYKDGKNQLALFSAPRKVVICPAFLKTLHEREIRSGYGEILKLLVTGGKEFLDVYAASMNRETGMPTSGVLKKLIFSALAVKKAVVEDDEFELNIRRSLNYGHTIGHALEVLSDYHIPHGQAVALGLMVVNRMAVRRGILSVSEDAEIDRLAKPLLGVQDLSFIKYDGMDALLQKDKKTLTNNFVFVFIRSAGDTAFVKYPKDKKTIDEILFTVKEIVAELKHE
jgi:3-dehydroquinate synthase